MARSHRDVPWCVDQQMIDDDVSGLLFRFEVLPSGEPVLRIYGAILPHGNRLIRFSQSGELVHLATSVLGTERPNWPQKGAPVSYRPYVGDNNQNTSVSSRRITQRSRKPR